MPLRPQSLLELHVMCLGGFTYSIDLAEEGGGGSFFKLTVYPAYLFSCRKRPLWNSERMALWLRSKQTAGWQENLATKCGGGTERGTLPPAQDDENRAARRPTDRRERTFGRGWGCLPPTPLGPSSLPEMKSGSGRKNCCAGFPPTTALASRRLSPSSI